MNTGPISPALPRHSPRLCGVLGALLVTAWQFSVSAQIPGSALDGIAYSPVTGPEASNSVAFIASESEAKAPSQGQDNVPVFPDSSTDLDDDDGDLDDIGANTTTGDDHDFFHFSVTIFNEVTLGRQVAVEASFPSLRCFFCLREHVRERAPPNLR